MTKISETISRKIANMSLLCSLIVVHIHYPKKAIEQGYSYGDWLSVMEFIHRVFPAGLNRIAVPFFFIVSGYLVAGHIGKDKWWKAEVCKRVRSLLVPYLALNLLVLGFFVVSRTVFSGEVTNGIDVLRSLGLYHWCDPAVGALWYIRDLFLYVILLPLFLPIVKRSYWMSILFCISWFALTSVISWAVGNGVSSNVVLCNIESARSWGLAFFIAGVAFRFYGVPEFSIKRGWEMLALGIVLNIVAIGYCPDGVYSSSNVGYLVASFFGWPLSVAGLWTVISDKSWPKWIVSSSFAIYIWHFVIIVFVTGSLKHLNEFCPGIKLYCLIACNPFGYVFGMVALVLATIVVSRIFSKFRWLNAIFQGGRL